MTLKSATFPPRLPQSSIKLWGLFLAIAVSAHPAICQPATSPEKNNAQQETNAKESTEANLHKVQMRITGSSCLSCLEELEKRLKEQPGIDKVKIEFPAGGVSFFSMQGPLWSLAHISYRPSQLPLNKLLQFIEHQGYHPYKVMDKALP